MLRTPIKDEQSSLSLFKDPVQVSYRNTRDSIIAKVQELAPKAAWTPILVGHLKKMGSSKLDPYNKIHFSLQEFSLGLDFFTGLVDGEALTYTVPENPGDPAPEFRRSKFLGLF